MKNKKIAAAVSGGIDSLVAAFLLKRKGYDVTGIHFFTGYEQRPQSQIKSDLEKMAKTLDIPIVFLDIKKEFKAGVVNYFTKSYKRGLTPNPCLVCNPLIKFSLLIKKANQLGIDKIATGHYVDTEIDKNGDIYILKGRDEFKDQSYFLSMVKKKSLKKVVFPLAKLKKNQVRKIAQNFNLFPMEKKESQDICFIKKNSYSNFIEKETNSSFRPGKIIDSNGNKIGIHKGLHNFTIGQRKGINCPGPYPYYVLGLDPGKNTLIIGSKKELEKNYCIVNNINWFKKPDSFPITLSVKIRYAHKPQIASITQIADDRLRIDFTSPVNSVAPGQGAVFYDDNKIIGAGFIIKKNEKI